METKGSLLFVGEMTKIATFNPLLQWLFHPLMK
jgi:hypothetical protein